MASESIKLNSSTLGSFLPITEIFRLSQEDLSPNKKNLASLDKKVNACYQALFSSLNILSNNLCPNFRVFDAHLAATCCQVTAVVSMDLIRSIKSLNLLEIRKEAESNFRSRSVSFYLPDQLVKLAQLLILGELREVGNNGIRSNYKIIKDKYGLSDTFAKNFAWNLQVSCANEMVINCENILKSVSGKIRTNGAPIEVWGKYITARKDLDRGFSVMPYLYSMQVCLAKLIFNKSVVLLANTIMDPKSLEVLKIQKRILRGNGFDGFVEESCKNFSKDEPVAVFSGSSLSNTPDQLSECVNKHDFMSLIFACDVKVPQFSKSLSTSRFASSEVVPDEDVLRSLIDTAKIIKGVSVEDPSLFCLNHIFLSSIGDIESGSINESPFLSSLPLSSIQKKILNIF